MRVLQVGITSNIGGTESYLINQLRCIDHNKIQYDILSRDGDRKVAFEDDFRSCGCNIYRIVERNQHPLRHYCQLIRFLRASAKRYDAIVINANSRLLGCTLVFAWWFGIKIRIYHSHAASGFCQGGIVHKIVDIIELHTIRLFSTHLWACSENAARCMFGSTRKVSIIPNAIEFENFRFRPESRMVVRSRYGFGDECVVGMVGNFMPVKNHQYLVTVFKELVRRIPSAKLLLVGAPLASEGDAVLRNIRQLIKDCSLEQRVVFTGRTENVGELMSAMDIFVLPSISEGFGMVAIEAQVSGLPSVLSEGVSRDTKISERVVFLPLAKETSRWVSAIESFWGGRRIPMSYTEFERSGFDVCQVAKRVEKLFLEIA